MSWARYDDEFPINRKVGRLIGHGTTGIAAIGLHLIANTYCRHNGTAGLVEKHVPGLLVGPVGRKLAKLLEQEGMFDPVDGGWMIHDYAEFHDPNDPDPDRSAADRKKEVSEKRAEAGRRGGLAKAAKQTSSKASDLLVANGVANDLAKPWHSSTPDPVPVPLLDTDTPPPQDDSGGGGSKSVDKRRNAVIQAYAKHAADNAKSMGNRTAYESKAADTCRAHPDLERYVTRYPDAPVSAVAAWLHGDKHSMRYYTEVDPGAPDADVVNLSERRPA